MKYRHEEKLIINYSDYLALRSRLKAVMKQDAHAGEDGTYLIRSLYFDNYEDQALREKLYGVNDREKFRIRYYNMDDTVIHLEKKSKKNGLCSKMSAELLKPQAEDILEGRIEFLSREKDALLLDFYSKMTSGLLRPKVIVDYNREAYIYEAGNVRVTFDSRIRTSTTSNGFFRADVPMVPAYGEKQIILEIKFDEFLPEIIAMVLQAGNLRITAFSKYAAARLCYL